MEIVINDKKINTLERLNDFTPKQIIQFVNSVYVYDQKHVPNREVLMCNAQRTLIKILLNQGEAFFKAWKQDADRACFSDCGYPSDGQSCANKGQCKHSQLYWLEYTQLLEITDPFFEYITLPDSPKKLVQVKQNLTVQKFPIIKLKKGIFIGAKDGMENLTFDQWMYADLAYGHYMNTGDVDNLRELCAALYDTEKGMDYDDRVKAFQGLCTSHRYAILLFYVSCRRMYAAIFDRIFKIPTEEKLKDAIEKKETIQSIWYDTKFHIARQGLFGSFDQIGNQSIFNVLKHLNMLDCEREERERAEAIQAARSNR